MKLTTKTKDRFRPDWDENLSLPVQEQVTVSLKYPTAAQKELYKETRVDVGGQHLVIKYYKEKIINECVDEIENLVDEVDGKEVPLKTAAALLASRHPRIPLLIDKIVAQVMNADDVPEEEEKNSE